MSDRGLPLVCATTRQGAIKRFKQKEAMGELDAYAYNQDDWGFFDPS